MLFCQTRTGNLNSGECHLFHLVEEPQVAISFDEDSADKFHDEVGTAGPHPLLLSHRMGEGGLFDNRKRIEFRVGCGTLCGC